jgi:hypothetical protein
VLYVCRLIYFLFFLLHDGGILFDLGASVGLFSAVAAAKNYFV